MQPWAHQARLLEERIPQVKERCFIIHSPTGSGKTFVATKITEAAVKEGMRVMLMAPRIELIGQFCRKLDEFLHMSYGVITANRDAQNLYQPVQVASLDTLVSRVVRRKKLVLPPTDIVICDEVHLYVTAQRMELLKQFPNARIIGLTATPGRPDGRALSGIFDRIISAASVRELTEQGILVPAVYYAPSVPDLKKIRVVRGDYEQKGVESSMQPLLGDIVAHWLKHAASRRTVVFAACIGHSVYLADLFRQQGVAAEHCDGKTPPEERKAVFERFSSGETQVLCNVDLATYGFDLPELDCVVFARPTKSIVRYLQSIGRGLRSSPGKENCLVLDHAGCVHEHGFADEERYWTLKGLQGLTREKRAQQRSRDKAAPKKLTCERCTFIFSGSLTCPNCGFHFESMAREFYVHEGELIPFKVNMREAGLIEKRHFHAELLGYAKQKNYQVGWAAHAYKSKFREFPPRDWNSSLPITPSLATLRYVRSLNIRRANAMKSRKAKEAQA